MTTRITIHAGHGCPVQVCPVDPETLDEAGAVTVIAAGETRDLHVWAGCDLLIHELAPRAPAEAPPLHEGLPVAGYRPQTDGAVLLVNRHKDTEERILRHLDGLKGESGIDQRWLSIGRTRLEEALMAINRAVFRPGRARLPEDGQ